MGDGRGGSGGAPRLQLLEDDNRRLRGLLELQQQDQPMARCQLL